MKDPMSLRLGPLADPVIKAAKKSGATPSEWVRAAIAKQLGVDPPEMRAGSAANADTAARANAARWSPRPAFDSCSI